MHLHLGKVAGVICGLIGLTVGLSFGINGALSQPNSADVGISLSTLGLSMGIISAVAGIIICKCQTKKAFKLKSLRGSA